MYSAPYPNSHSLIWVGGYDRIATRDYLQRLQWTGSKLSLDAADGAWSAPYPNEKGFGSGDRGEDPAPRIRDAEEHVQWFNTQFPDAKLTHEFSTHEPEEENMILEHCLFAPYLPPFVMVPGYVQWAMQQGLRGLRVPRDE